MTEWLRRSTRIHKILCSNLSILIYGMTLDKSLTAKLSRTAHSYHANASSVSTLDRRSADTTICKKKKDDRNRLYVDPNNNHCWSQGTISLWEVIIIIISTVPLASVRKQTKQKEKQNEIKRLFFL